MCTQVVPKPRVVILGSGWGSFRFLRNLDKSKYEVTVVSPRNHFLFTPLLASTTVGTLDFRSIIQNVRSSKKDLHFYQAHCTAIDFNSKQLTCVEKENVFQLPYDKLVIGVGCKNHTFGIPGVEEHAYFLKELHHARAIRSKIIECFERASLPNKKSEERVKLLHFVIVGGGPTSVEFAAELSDFLWQDVGRYFPEVPLAEVKLTLLEAGHHILSMFDKRLVDKAIRNLAKRGVTVRTDCGVRGVTEKGVHLSDGTYMDCGMVIWSTGVGPRALVEGFTTIRQSRQHRILVDDHLRVPGVNGVYALGDCAQIENMPLACTAQVAEQQGKYLAKVFNKNLDGPFKFLFRGLLLYTGRYEAVYDSPWYHGYGILSWLMWRSVYLTTLGSYRNKFQVPAEWLRTIIWGRDVTSFDASEDSTQKHDPHTLPEPKRKEEITK